MLAMIDFEIVFMFLLIVFLAFINWQSLVIAGRWMKGCLPWFAIRERPAISKMKITSNEYSILVRDKVRESAYEIVSKETIPIRVFQPKEFHPRELWQIDFNATDQQFKSLKTRLNRERIDIFAIDVDKHKLDRLKANRAAEQQLLRDAEDSASEERPCDPFLISQDRFIEVRLYSLDDMEQLRKLTNRRRNFEPSVNGSDIKVKIFGDASVLVGTWLEWRDSGIKIDPLDADFNVQDIVVERDGIRNVRRDLREKIVAILGRVEIERNAVNKRKDQVRHGDKKRYTREEAFEELDKIWDSLKTLYEDYETDAK
jgi:hypothetical protein